MRLAKLLQPKANHRHPIGEQGADKEQSIVYFADRAPMSMHASKRARIVPAKYANNLISSDEYRPTSCPRLTARL